MCLLATLGVEEIVAARIAVTAFAISGKMKTAERVLKIVENVVPAAMESAIRRMAKIA